MPDQKLTECMWGWVVCCVGGGKYNKK